VIAITYVEVRLGNRSGRRGRTTCGGSYGYQADTAIRSYVDGKVRGAVIAQPEKFQRRKVSGADSEQLSLPQVQE